MAGGDSVLTANGARMPLSTGGYAYGGASYRGGGTDIGSGGSGSTKKQHSTAAAPPHASYVVQHRGQLDPRFEVLRDTSRPVRGRGVFATQDVKGGTKVMVARQTAAVPMDRYRTAFCRRCLVLLDKSTLIKCRRCEDRFCGKGCVIAAAGEGTHEATCGFVENLDYHDHDVEGPQPGRRGGSDWDGGGDKEGEEHKLSLNEASRMQLEATYSPAATETELLRLTMECLARRRAGLIDESEWEEILDLDSGERGESADAAAEQGNEGSAPAGGAGGTKLHPAMLREAQARLKGGRVRVSEEEIQMVYTRYVCLWGAVRGCLEYPSSLILLCVSEMPNGRGFFWSWQC